jgi:antitoxin VapB
MSESKAKIFWSGRSQAVRLPKEFRVEEGISELGIRRQGDLLILELPKTAKADEWAWLETLEALDDDVVAAAEEDEGPFEDRPERDAFSK